MAEREYSYTTRPAEGGGVICDYSNVPCGVCKPKTLGECGHHPMFADEDWTREQHNNSMRELGRKMAYEREMQVLNLLLGKES